MTDLSIQTWALLVAIVAVVVLAMKYNALQSTISERVQKELDSWRSRELGSARTEMERVAKGEAGVALERWRTESEASIRSDAIKRSLAVVSGKVTEHLAPYMGAFPYNPKDVRFLGSPVDLIVFDGMSDDTLQQIVFLEIKTAGATLTTRERRIRDAVEGKRVVWREFRVRGDA